MCVRYDLFKQNPNLCSYVANKHSMHAMCLFCFFAIILTNANLLSDELLSKHFNNICTKIFYMNISYNIYVSCEIAAILSHLPPPHPMPTKPPTPTPHWVSIGSDNGLSPIRRQAII